MTLFETPALGPDLHQRHVRRIVNEQWGIGDLAHRARQPGPVLVAHRALAHVLQLDRGFGREQAHGDLGPAHLEAEEDRCHFVLDSRRAGDVQSPGRVVGGNHGLTGKIEMRLVVDLNATHRDGLNRTHGCDQARVPALERTHPAVLVQQALTFQTKDVVIGAERKREGD